LIVFQAFAATGRHIARALRSSHRYEVALPAAWGLAAMALLGGWLNLFGVARSSVLAVLVLAVVALDFLWDWRAAIGMGEARPASVPEAPAASPDRWGGLWIVPLAGLVGIKYLASLAVEFSQTDDLPSYMLQLARMLQTGTVGIDPFSSRQLISLNGSSFVVALVCSVAPISYAHLLDPGICWIILAALTWSIIRRDLGGSPAESSLLTAMVLMADVPFINITGYLASTVLFLALIRTAYLTPGDEGDRGAKGLLLLALTSAGLFALKTTCIYYVGLFLVVRCGSRLRRAPGLAPVREVCLIGLISSALILPWMWQQYLSGGTPLYPLLGRGYDVTGPGLGAFDDPLTDKAKALLYYLSFAPVVATIVATILLASHPFRDDPARWRVLFASLASATTASLALAFYTASDSIGRYTLNLLYAALIAAGLHGYFSPKGSRAGIGLALCLAVFVGGVSANLHHKLAFVRQVVRAGRPATLPEEGEERRIREAQSSIPEGRTVAVCLEGAFLLDFSRNPIFNLDQMGMASPPPGLPITSDPIGLRDFLSHRTTRFPPPGPSDQILRYLRDAGVEYVMFQRGEDTAWYTHTRIADKPYWNRLVRTLALLVLGELKGLIQHCKAIYDDGDLIVLDLNSPAGRIRAGRAPTDVARPYPMPGRYRRSTRPGEALEGGSTGVAPASRPRSRLRGRAHGDSGDAPAEMVGAFVDSAREVSPRCCDAPRSAGWREAMKWSDRPKTQSAGLG
jgi:hypothetical protein